MGINSHKQEYLDMFPKLAKRLADNGIASVRFDFRGHGDSSGNSRDFSVVGQLIDLDAVHSWIKETFNSLSTFPSYVGVSFGGPPGIFLASTGCKYSSISLVAPVLSYEETFLDPSTEWAAASFNPAAYEIAVARGYLLLDGTFEISLRLLHEMSLLHPDVVVGSLEIPTLLIHGTVDPLVPCKVSRRVGMQYPQINLHVIDGMDHGLFMAGDDEGQTEQSKTIEVRALDLVVSHILANIRSQS